MFAVLAVTYLLKHEFAIKICLIFKVLIKKWNLELKQFKTLIKI